MMMMSGGGGEGERKYLVLPLPPLSAATCFYSSLVGSCCLHASIERRAEDRSLQQQKGREKKTYPMRVNVPPNVTAYAIGISSLRASIPARCDQAIMIGISIATIGVLLSTGFSVCVCRGRRGREDEIRRSEVEVERAAGRPREGRSSRNRKSSPDESRAHGIDIFTSVIKSGERVPMIPTMALSRPPVCSMPAATQ